MRRFDGVYRWFLFRAKPLRDEAGNIIKWYGTNTDIDDRKRAEEQLRQEEKELKHSEARKAAILESALDCIVTIDHEGRITEFNPAAEHTFGYRRDEVLGKHWPTSSFRRRSGRSTGRGLPATWPRARRECLGSASR